MRELSLSYTDANSGNNASTIGWINFGNIFLNPGEILTGLYVRLFDGSILSFDLKNDSNTDTGFALRSTSVPVTSDSNFGVLGYTNISGNIALIKTPLPTSVEGEDSALFTLSNISYLSSSGTPISRFTLNVVDLYNLNSSEDPSGDFQQYITNGTQWNLVELIGRGPSPIIDITNESSTPITISTLTNGITPLAVEDSISVADITYPTADTRTPILSTESPSFIQSHFIATTTNPIQGFAIGISTPNPNAICRSRGVNLFR